jgi:ribonuclease HII
MGLKDSKQLDRKTREKLDRKIRKVALAFAVVAIDAETIDRVNIYQASRLAMRLAVEQLTVPPDHLLIDAVRIDSAIAQTKLYYGDSLSLSIAAASVVAKVHRDALLRDFDKQFPQYGLANHKGYATPEHRQALKQHGPCPLHRRSFAPVLAADPEAALDAQLELEDFFDEELPPEELAADELAMPSFPAPPVL